MKPQCEKILRFMGLYGSITPNEAKDVCRCQRLASRIRDLKDLGIGIDGKMESGVNADGDTVPYKKYWLKAVQTEIERSKSC